MNEKLQDELSGVVVSVVGLGYVGLPVAIAMSKKFPTMGFDVQKSRIEELKAGHDRNHEVYSGDLGNIKIEFTSEPQDLKRANFHIVAVPTPIDSAKTPDLRALIGASEIVGSALKKGDIVVYESTVYPGATEEDCVPVLERTSGLKCGVDFKVGYSPERINPGDTEHQFEDIKKVVSGQDAESLRTISAVYGAVVKAGIHEASTIKVAEAAKVIENTQRDLNIALMNELALIFDQMNVDTQAVLDAAATKWNFLRFIPGLVGGHCIGVDPYYLTHKAEKMGYKPQVITAGRNINDGMGKYIAQRTIKQMIHAGHNILGSVVNVMGLAFKENCRDIRNTRVTDIVNELKDYGVEVQVCDPVVDADEAQAEYGVGLTPMEKLKPASAMVLAVAHKAFSDLTPEFLTKNMTDNPVVVDVKGVLPEGPMRASGIRLWRL